MGVTFATELRAWRTRRRVSQLELALRAGTTQRHVSFIEGGRSVPGRGMVVRLAESLDVPLRERNALLLAAGFAPAYPETRWDDPALAPVREALLRVLDGHLPYPAVIVDRAGDAGRGQRRVRRRHRGRGPGATGAAGQRRAAVPAPGRRRATHPQPRRVGMARHRPPPRDGAPQPRRPAHGAGRGTHALRRPALGRRRARGVRGPASPAVRRRRAAPAHDARPLRHRGRRHRRRAAPGGLPPGRRRNGRAPRFFSVAGHD